MRPGRWFSLALLSILCPAAFLAVQAGGGRGANYAFLVGCSAYDKTELRPLPYTIDDVEGFKKAILATGFEPDNVIVLHDRLNATRYRPLKQNIVAELQLLVEGMRPQDTLVVALSGHGLHYKGDKTGYFCPVDAKVADKSTLIPMNGPGGVFDILKSCKAGKKLLIVNACRNDPTTDLALAAQKIDIDDEDSDEVPFGIAAIYSCRQGQKSYYDPDRKLSLFYDHLIRAWQGEYLGGGKVKLEHVLEQVVLKTKADANKTLRASQVPEVRREYKGEWVISETAVAASTAPVEKVRLIAMAVLQAGLQASLAETDPLDVGFYKGYRKEYPVRFDAGKSYRIDVRGEGNLDTLLRIEDESSRPLFYNDDACPPRDLNARAIFTPSKAGVYHLIVTSYSPNSMGKFELKIGAAVAVGQPKVLSGNLVQTTDLYQEKYLVRHLLTLTAGRHYVIELHSPEFDTYLVVGDPVGKKALGDTGQIAPGSPHRSRIDFTPLETKQYIIGITSSIKGQTGPYTCTLQEFRSDE